MTSFSCWVCARCGKTTRIERGAHDYEFKKVRGKSAPGQLSAESLIGTMEALLIEGLEPRQNRKREAGFNAIEYLQVPFAKS